MEEILSRLKEEIDRRLQTGSQILIAIDGNCTAGKSTLASALAKEYDCNVFHMDDFFLQQKQRTPERYAEPGGNVDYERFRDEVLIPLRQARSFSYRPFSCSTFTFSEPIAVSPKQLNIVEGTYSQHPHFGAVYDLKIFLTVSSALQRQRILERPPFLHQRFFESWIPMEQRYFDFYQIPRQCDLFLDLTQRKYDRSC